MKKSILILTSLILCILTFSQCKKELDQTATIIRDCTGVYLRIQGEDFQVCNIEKVVSYKNGDVVKVDFSRIKECKGTAKDVVVCYMLHENQGWVQVHQIQ